MKVIILPDGVRVNMDNVTHYSHLGAAANFSDVDGVIQTYNAYTEAGAVYLLSQVDAIISANKDGIFQVKESGCTIFSYSPAPFNVNTDTIIVTGSGFKAETIGNLWVDDLNIVDFNGFKFAATFINENTISAVLISIGDGVLGAYYNMVYKDSDGRVSNSIPVPVMDT